MYFVRYFNNSESSRTKYAVWKCNACGKEHWLEVRRDPYHTDPIPCPDCKALDANDLRMKMAQKRDELLKQITALQAEVDKINVELVTTDPVRAPVPTHSS